jgi:outer membrane lipoprotein-sorting protein
VYVSEYNEVSLTEPTAEELREVNPLAMIEHYVATDRISSNEDGTINFYPTQPKESEYFRVELRLNKTNLPTRLTVYQTNGNRVTIYLEEFKKISVDNSSFVFDITKYPNVEVNDLR